MKAKKHISKYLIDYLYNDESLSAPVIAKRLNVGVQVIYNRMKDYGIKRRTLKEAIGGKRNPNYTNGWTTKKNFCKCGKPISIRAKTCAFCVDYEVRKKAMRENHANFKGSNHPQWKGGFDKEGYPHKYNKEFKKNIRKLYGNKCHICGATSQVNGKNMEVHHIDYDKNNLDESNLITLCRACHSKTNHNREHWRELLSEKVHGLLSLLAGNK